MRVLREKLNKFGCRHAIGKENYDEKYFLRTFEGSPVSPLYMKFLLSTIFKDASFILDAGCGTGECINIAKEYGKDVIGIDVSRYAAKRTRQILSNVVNMPFKDETFDGIVAFEVIEHLVFSNAICFLKECYRVLKEGGSLALSTPNWLPRLWLWLRGITDPTHKFYYNPFSIVATLRSCGFDKVQVMSPIELRLRLKIPLSRISIFTLFGLGMIVVCNKPGWR